MASDNFNRADENPLSNAGTWAACDSVAQLKLVSNAVTGVFNTETVSLWTQGGATSNHSAECTLSKWQENNQGGGVVVRGATDAATYYYVRAHNAGGANTSLDLRKRVAGTFGNLASAIIGTPSVDTPLKLTVLGTTLTVYVGGVQKLQTTDSDIASGFLGLTMNTTDFVPLYLDNFVGSYNTFGEAVTLAVTADLLHFDPLLPAYFGQGYLGEFYLGHGRELLVVANPPSLTFATTVAALLGASLLAQAPMTFSVAAAIALAPFLAAVGPLTFSGTLAATLTALIQKQGAILLSAAGTFSASPLVQATGIVTLAPVAVLAVLGEAHLGPSVSITGALSLGLSRGSIFQSSLIHSLTARFAARSEIWLLVDALTGTVWVVVDNPPGTDWTPRDAPPGMVWVPVDNWNNA